MSEPLRQRELQAAREIAAGFDDAGTAVEVYRLALARLTPLVGATFASVFVRDHAEPGLLKLACAQNWPQPAARYLGSMRVREGRGPTGRAVESGEVVEVADIEREAGREWRQAARELGFVAMIALPLQGTTGAMGALSFYFDRPRSFRDDERLLLRAVAGQLADSVQRAREIDDLRAVNQQLKRTNDQLRGRLDGGAGGARLSE